MGDHMKKRTQLFTVLLALFSLALIFTACSNNSAVHKINQTEEEGVENKYDRLAKEKNEELSLEPLILTDYSNKVGLDLESPDYELFAVNNEVVIKGKIAKYEELKSDYVWIKVTYNGEGPAGTMLEYYAPIKEGKFKEALHFFNGEGEYMVTIHLPDTKSENYYYEVADFTVINVNPKKQRDLAYSPAGHEAELSIDLETSYMKKNGSFLLEGEVGNISDNTIMIYLNKEMDSWKHVIPVKNGRFHYEVPLYYGAGLHSLDILVPDRERENYYEAAVTILIDNESEQRADPIEFFGDLYIVRGINLEYPSYNGIEMGQSLRIAGSVDPVANFAEATTHLYITTKKGDDETLEVIPVEDFAFDSSLYLRFGPGTYEVTVSVPEIKEENSDYFRYFSVAKFKVVSTQETDKRDLLPSRGVQSDDPQIIKLAEDLIKDKQIDREKAKAIYEYVAKNISYDVEKLENHEFAWDDSALKTLHEGSGVCQDYAYLTIALLRAGGFEARFVEGITGGSMFGTGVDERHAWVEARIDGRWLTMDPTWGAGFLDGGMFVANYNDDYFDPNPTQFAKTHERIGVSY